MLQHSTHLHASHESKVQDRQRRVGDPLRLPDLHVRHHEIGQGGQDDDVISVFAEESNYKKKQLLRPDEDTSEALRYLHSTLLWGDNTTE